MRANSDVKTGQSTRSAIFDIRNKLNPLLVARTAHQLILRKHGAALIGTAV